MNTESQQQTQPGQEAQQSQSAGQDQNQTQQEVHIFDQDFTMPSEDDDMLGITFDDDFESQQENAEEQQEEQSENQTQENQNNDDLNFDDANQNSEQEENEEDLIAKLKEKGYDIKKPNESSEQQTQDQELQRLQNVINQSTSFIQSDDKTVITEKERSNLIDQYKKSGKEGFINTDEFNIELEANIEEIMNNPTTSKIYADNIRRNVKDFLSEKQSEYNGIKQKLDDAHNQKITENRQNLQNTFKGLYKNGFLGQKVSQDEAEEAYQSIVSGEFSKQINNSPELVAKFALFLKKEQELSGLAEKPSYGEGVKDAVDNIIGKGDNSKKSPLSQGLNKNSNSSGQEVKDMVKRFGGPDVVQETEEKKDEKKYVAGASMY